MNMPSDFEIFQFIIERWEFLIGLLVGGGSLHVVNKIVIKKRVEQRQKGHDNQAQQVTESPGSNLQTGGRDAHRQEGAGGVLASINDSPGASIVVGNNEPRVGTATEALGSQPTFPTGTPVSLNVNQSHIFQKVQEILQRLNLNSAFQARYQSAVGHLNNNNAQICSSEYHAAFLDVVPTLLERTAYSTNAPTDDNLTTLRDAFGEIRNFMNSASNDDSVLRTAIRNFENALIVILGYL